LLQAETQFCSQLGQPVGLDCFRDLATQRAATLIISGARAIRENQIITTRPEGIEVTGTAEVELRPELAGSDSLQALKDVEAIVRDSIWIWPPLLVSAGNIRSLNYVRDEHKIGFSQLIARWSRARATCAQPERYSGAGETRDDENASIHGMYDHTLIIGSVTVCKIAQTKFSEAAA
jgi:hypothetical protein